MRWLARRPLTEPPAPDPIERIDPATLEVVEMDVLGRLHGPPAPPRDARIPEIGYGPRDRDPTSLAGVWEALARS